jgi:hypothetical protein
MNRRTSEVYKDCPHKKASLFGADTNPKYYCGQFPDFNMRCQPAYGCTCPVVFAKWKHIKQVGHRKPPPWDILKEQLLQGKLKRG